MNKEQLENAIKATAIGFNKTPGEVKQMVFSKRRFEEVAMIRHTVAYLTAMDLKHGGFRWSKAGRMLICDHSTIINSVKQIKDIVSSKGFKYKTNIEQSINYFKNELQTTL